ncbi:MAG: hypothetical protein WA580_07455 [Acidimicrobiales bacterium]
MTGEDGSVQKTPDFLLVDAFLDFHGDTRRLGQKISAIEASFSGLSGEEAASSAALDGITSDLLRGAHLVKMLSSQVDVVLHASGIVTSLPLILDPEERISFVSLGAGNASRGFDLMTNMQVAEFKFITWRGADAVRQDNLVIDIFNLDQFETSKRKVVYLFEADIPIKWLQSSRRKTRSVLGRKAGAPARFDAVYGPNRFEHVFEYWALAKNSVEIVDLKDVVPDFR